MKTILVCGGAGFIGHHLARRLMNEGHWVVVADIKSVREAEEFGHLGSYCSQYRQLDLKRKGSWNELASMIVFNEVYQLAADMGGAGYIFTGENDLEIMRNSALINLHCVDFAVANRVKVFYSSSACIYPAYNQVDPNNPKCSEDSAYPAEPDSEYGWEKLFSEHLYMSAKRNADLDVRIARFHNIYGPEGAWDNGKEKAPAAISRKVLKADKEINIWGDGKQTRSFLYIEDCLDAIQLLMKSDYKEPINIGSEEMVTINQLVDIACKITGKQLKKTYSLDKPQGVRGRNSDNTMIRKELGWSPKYSLEEGLTSTIAWIRKMINDRYQI